MRDRSCRPIWSWVIGLAASVLIATLASPSVARADSIVVSLDGMNIGCVFNCPTTTHLGPGGAIVNDPFSIGPSVLTFLDGDQFSLVGSMTAINVGTFGTFTANIRATYLGNNGAAVASVAQDVLNVILVQFFTPASPVTTLAGFEFFSGSCANLGSTSTVAGAEGVSNTGTFFTTFPCPGPFATGLVPFAPVINPIPLELNTALNPIFTFAEGSSPGANATMTIGVAPPVPEPSTFVTFGSGLMGTLMALSRRRKSKPR